MIKLELKNSAWAFEGRVICHIFTCNVTTRVQSRTPTATAAAVSVLTGFPTLAVAGWMQSESLPSSKLKYVYYAYCFPNV